MTTWDGKLVVGGSYNSPCGKIATWDGTTYECLAGGVGIVARSACEWEGKLVVVGDFWNVFQPCADCNGIAVWDGTSWSNLGTGFNNDVLAVYNWDGTLVAAGDFTTADGLPCSRIAWWDGSAWQPFGGPSDFDNDIRCIVAFDGDLWVGGDFNNVAGCTACDGLVRWTGTEWVGGDSGVDIQGGVDETVRNLYVSPTNGNLYMGGHFTDLNIDGTWIPFNGIAMYDGSAWSPLDAGVNDYVRAVYEYNGNLIVGGGFTSASGTPANYIAKWNNTTDAWEAMGDGMDGTSDIPEVKASCVWNGIYFAGGTFDEADGLSSPKISQWAEPLGPFTTGVGGTNDPTCSGDCDGSGTVSATGGAPPYTFLWDDPSAQTTATATGLCAGTYTVTITDGVGAVSTETVVINDPPGLSASASVSSDYNGADISCFGDSDGEVTVTASGGDPGYFYEWDDPAAQTTETATGLPAGTYIVTVTDDGGCSVTASVTLSDPTALGASVGGSTDVSCFGDADGDATVSASGGTGAYAYLWDDASAQTTATASGLAGGDYCVTVTDANGCEASDCITIAEPAALAGSAAVSTDYLGFDISCNGAMDGAGLASPTGGTPGYTYLWDDPSGQTTAEATGLGAGTYNVYVTDDNGCTTSFSVTLTEPDAITLSSSFVASSCSAADGSATVSATGGTGMYTYLWDAAAGSQTTSTATGLSSGSYSVDVTDENGCTESTTVVVSDADAPVLTGAATDALCFGECNGVASVTASGGAGGYTYLWDAAAGSATTASVTDLCAGTYEVTVTDVDGCSSIETVTISEPAEMTIDLSSTPEVSGCDASATVTAAGGTSPFTYQWDAAAGSQTTATATDLCAGTFCVTVTDDNDCHKDTCITIGPNGITDYQQFIQFYPNPSETGIFTVTNQLQTQLLVRVYDASGKLVMQQNLINGKNQLYVNAERSIYFVEVSDDAGLIIARDKLIIQ